MKKLIVLLVLLGTLKGVQAQQQKTTRNAATTPDANRLQSRGNYQARGYRPDTNLFISDPVIRAMNTRRAGTGAPLYGSNSIMGLPKGTYGYGKGQLWLRTTDATSIGGVTGNSSVGNGSSIGGVGAGGATLGVNGKNPYAGSSMWGSVKGMNLPDSVVRRVPARQR